MSHVPFSVSVLDIGCRTAHGEAPTDVGAQRVITNLIFEEFRDFHVNRVDGVPLVYNPAIGGEDASVPLSRADGHGQCGAFADLLYLTFNAQGVNATKRRGTPIQQYDSFKVKGGKVLGGATFGEREYVYHALVKTDVYPNHVFDPAYGLSVVKSNEGSAEEKWENERVVGFYDPQMNAWGGNPAGAQLTWS